MTKFIESYLAYRCMCIPNRSNKLNRNLPEINIIGSNLIQQKPPDNNQTKHKKPIEILISVENCVEEENIALNNSPVKLENIESHRREVNQENEDEG